jgi:hypothetical protein
MGVSDIITVYSALFACGAAVLVLLCLIALRRGAEFEAEIKGLSMSSGFA